MSPLPARSQPIRAHHRLSILQIFVAKEHWLDDRTFNDLLALGQALPGPAFSQLAFSISALRGGITAAMLSFVLLT